MTDTLKLKFALAKTRRPKRVTLYDYDINSAPEKCGLIANKEDYDMATPNLTRKEDIYIVASNSTSKEGLVLKIHWRPSEESKIATIVSSLQFTTNDQSVYEYENIETYRPTVSSIRPGRITQYGSNGSQLKLFIACPYRRMRLLFHGQMRKVGTDTTIFVKLNAVMSPVSDLYDFNQQVNPDCLKLSFAKWKPKRDYANTITDLLYQDRHEHIVRLRFECTIFEDSNKLKLDSFLWGIHARHFLADSKPVQTKRIMAVLNNGHSWHLCQASADDGDKIDFGYTCMEIIGSAYPIEKPTKINWDTINQETKEFSLTLYGEERELDYQAKIRREGQNFYELTGKNALGWAFIMIDDGLETSADWKAKIVQSQEEYKLALKEGLICDQQVLESATKELVVRISEFECASNNLVGSKASSLAQLQMLISNEKVKDSNFIVPKAFVITRYAHDLIIANSEKFTEAIGRLTKMVSEGDTESSKDECEFIQKLVSEIKLPAEICQALASKLSAEYGSDPIDQVPFAVRSSSWGEDEEGMSAAGQLDTLLGVKGLESIYNAVMKCFASKFSYENIEYKRQHGLPLDLPMAVVVQEMVECEKAGVMFTCDPTNGNNSMIVITANYGLGESVVSGQSDPDSIRVKSMQSGELKIEEVKVGEKKIIIDSQSMTNEQGTSGQSNYDRSKCCLSDDEILRLASCGRKLERYFHGPRDIEWGFMGGQMYLFQSRPVTGLDVYTEEELIHEHDKPSRAEVDFISRANVGEVMPYASSPFSVSYTEQLFSLFTPIFTEKLVGPGLPRNSPQICTALIYDSYHSFFVLRSNSFVGIDFSGKEKTIMNRALEIGLFGRELEQREDIKLALTHVKQDKTFYEGFRFEMRALPLRHFTFPVILRQRKTLARLRKEFRAARLSDNFKKNILRGYYEQLYHSYKILPPYFLNHLIVIALSGKGNVLIIEVLSKYFKEPSKIFAALAKFLGSSADVLSAEIPQRIANIAELIRTKEGEAEKFIQMSKSDALKYIEKDNDVPGLSELFAEFMSKFGHRCYNEFDVRHSDWRENPLPVVEMIQSNCKTVESQDQAKNSTAKLGLHNKPSTEDIIDSLGIENMDPKDRKALIKSIVPVSQRMVAAREMTKSIMIEWCGVIREITRLFGKEMQRQLLIPDADLLYYIYYDELEALTRDHQPGIVMQALRRRNMFKKHFSVPWKFDEIICGAHIVPDHLKPSKELDEKLANAPKLYGTPASSGRVQGKVCLVDGYKELDKIRPGNILLTHSTDIGFSPIFPIISGIITEVGGLISHGAVVAREYGLPGLLGIADVTRILKDGEEIILDADNGVIIRLDMGK